MTFARENRSPPKKMKKKSKKKQFVKQANNLDENRKIVHCEIKDLGLQNNEKAFYKVEISESEQPKCHLMIAAFSETSKESLLISLNKERAEEILKEFNNDYELMTSSLQVSEQRLYLLNPTYAKTLED